MNRKVKIILVQRNNDDPSILLERIAKAFPSGDLTIKLDYSEKTEQTKVSHDKRLEYKVIEATNVALEKANKEFEEKGKPEEIVKSKGKFKNYINNLSKSGIKVAVEAIIKGLISHFL